MADQENVLESMDSLSITEDDEERQELEENMALFATVVARIRFERLPQFALSIHETQRISRTVSDQLPSTMSTPASSCKVVRPPLFGSYHILYILEFETLERWILRVPCIGHPETWNDSAARALRSEVFTMRLIHRETTIPMPQVHGFDDTLENEIGCPFTVMDYIEGINGRTSWFDRSIDTTLLEQHRAKTLRDVAKAMQQLGKFTYGLCGAPEYSGGGNLSNVGPLRIPDADAMLQKMGSDDVDNSPAFCEIGPFTDAQQYLLSELERRQWPQDQYSQGLYKLVRLFIKWLPPDPRTPPFVLMHDDLDIQNVIVQADGSLAAIIDWDGIAAVPRCVGNEKFPSWLTRDWDPAMYAYGRKRDSGEPCEEDPPADLARYRSMYVKFMREYAAGGENNQTTGRSLLVDNLYIATYDPVCTHGIVERVFDECIRVRQWQRKKNDDNAEDEDKLYLYEFVTELEDGEFNQEQLSAVKEGFLGLWAKLSDLDGEFWSPVEVAETDDEHGEDEKAGENHESTAE